MLPTVVHSTQQVQQETNRSAAAMSRQVRLPPRAITTRPRFVPTEAKLPCQPDDGASSLVAGTIRGSDDETSMIVGLSVVSVPQTRQRLASGEFGAPQFEQYRGSCWLRSSHWLTVRPSRSKWSGRHGTILLAGTSRACAVVGAR